MDRFKLKPLIEYFLFLTMKALLKRPRFWRKFYLRSWLSTHNTIIIGKSSSLSAKGDDSVIMFSDGNDWQQIFFSVEQKKEPTISHFGNRHANFNEKLWFIGNTPLNFCHLNFFVRFRTFMFLTIANIIIIIRCFAQKLLVFIVLICEYYHHCHIKYKSL